MVRALLAYTILMIIGSPCITNDIKLITFEFKALGVNSLINSSVYRRQMGNGLWLVKRGWYEGGGALPCT